MGDSHHLGDDLERKLRGHLADEIAGTPLADRVDDPGAQPPHPFLEAGDHPRGEALVDQQPQLGMARWVHVQHHQLHAGQLIRGGVVDQRAANSRRVARRVPGGGDHVVVPGQRPESRSSRLGVEVHGRIPPQQGEHVVGDTGHEGVRAEEVDVVQPGRGSGVAGDRHRASSWSLRRPGQGRGGVTEAVRSPRWSPRPCSGSRRGWHERCSCGRRPGRQGCRPAPVPLIGRCGAVPRR